MATKNYTLKQAGTGEFERDVMRWMKSLMVESAREFVREAAQVAADLTPEEIVDSDGVRMRDRWTNRIDGDNFAPTEKIKLGSKASRINYDAGAAAVDFGRKRNSYEGFSRMGGSSQVPRGISKPVKEDLMRKSELIIGKARIRADAKFGRGVS